MDPQTKRKLKELDALGTSEGEIELLSIKCYEESRDLPSRIKKGQYKACVNQGLDDIESEKLEILKKYRGNNR